MKVLKVIGLASSKLLLELNVEKINENETLLEFLQGENIPIASSCMGVGQCKRCIVEVNDQTQLSCTTLIKSLPKLSTVGVSYL
jgi:ferredoxin